MTRAAQPRIALLEFENLCRRQRLPLTIQRRLIMEGLVGRTDHPSADRIFEDVRRRLPGVSRTTVYRVLETLVRVGAVRRVSHPGSAARFEARTDRHHHIVCQACGAIADVQAAGLDRLPLPDMSAAGFRVTDYSIHFVGLCPRCHRDKRSPGAGPSKTTRRRRES